MYLVDVLLARLIVAMTPPSSSTPFLLYGSRYKWLDSLSPFDTSPPKPSQVALQDLMQLQSILCKGHMTKQCTHVTSHPGQGQHMTALATHLEEHVVGGMVGELSLLLLTWPHTGKIEQVHTSHVHVCPCTCVPPCRQCRECSRRALY